MAENDDIKRVIILDEKKKNNEPVDEDAAQELLEELNKFADDEDDGQERVVTGVTRIRIKKRRKLSKLKKHLIILAASLVVLITVVIIAMTGVTNNYRVPVTVYEEYLNKPVYDGEELSYAYGNGLAQRRLKKLRQLLRETTDTYTEGLNASVYESEQAYESNRKEYGDDFSFLVKIDSAVPLNHAELVSLNNDFTGIVRDIGSSSLVRSGSGELTMAVVDLTSYLENARITRGYRLYCTRTVSYSGADGPAVETGKMEFIVVKLNGRWIMWDKIYDILRLSY
ncbi:MAG: hypothetical protein IKP31_02220 [Lachnospiraceae bacterium]|nr:hypothetical protein [Lachnospiraceae bacterium]